MIAHGLLPLAALATLAAPADVLEVVAIRRPVELTGRYVKVPREVHLRAAGAVALEPGEILVVLRRVRPVDGAPAIERRIGAIRVVRADGVIVSAEVVEDALAAGADAASPEHVDLPAVMVGDFARLPPHPGDAAPPSPELTDADRAHLDAVRKSLIRHRTRPTPKKATLGPWEREVMKWRL